MINKIRHKYGHFTYDAHHGIYVPAGECIIEAELELLYLEISTHKVQEVTDKIEPRTLTNKNEFYSNEEIINVENELLNVHTRRIMDH